MSFNSFFIISRAPRWGKNDIFWVRTTSFFHNQSTCSQKFQADPPRRPEEADEVGRVIKLQMGSRERLFEKLMTHPKVDEAYSNALYNSLGNSLITDDDSSLMAVMPAAAGSQGGRYGTRCAASCASTISESFYICTVALWEKWRRLRARNATDAHHSFQLSN